MNIHVQSIVAFTHLLEDFSGRYFAKNPRVVISFTSTLPGPTVQFLSIKEAKETLGVEGWRYEGMTEERGHKFITFGKIVDGVRCIFTLDQDYAGRLHEEATLPAHAESGTPEAFALARAAHHPESEGAD